MSEPRHMSRRWFKERLTDPEFVFRLFLEDIYQTHAELDEAWLKIEALQDLIETFIRDLQSGLGPNYAGELIAQELKNRAGKVLPWLVGEDGDSPHIPREAACHKALRALLDKLAELEANGETFESIPLTTEYEDALKALGDI